MSEAVAPGQVLLGKYSVERVLGQGGMGLVVAVRHVELRQLWAMKFLLPDALDHRESLERFLREAQAAACLKNDHIVHVQDVGRMENGAPYMIMEYLEGCDLKAYLSRQGPLPVQQAVMYVLQVCEAIAEAHAAGIVHRDLKPANLFLIHRRDGSPCVKVLDFGISKQIDSEALDLTNTNATLGSPLYMSPEQMSKSKTVDVRTDIWALGVILYELLAGTSPFRGASLLEVASRVLQEEPTPLHDLRRDVPNELETLIAMCLRKRRDDRFQTIQELRDALAPFGPPSTGTQQALPVPATISAPIMPGVSTAGAATGLTFGQTGKSIAQKRPRWMARTVLGAGSVVVIGGGLGFWQSTHPATQAAESIASITAPVVPLSLAMMPSVKVDEPEVTSPEKPAAPLVSAERLALLPDKPKQPTKVVSVPPASTPSSTSAPLSSPVPAPTQKTAGPTPSGPSRRKTPF